MSTNNVDGSYRSTRERIMAAFDKLPASARRELANSVENWATQPLLTGFRRGQRAEDICARIRRWDAQELAMRAKDAALARGPYKGNARVAAP